MGCGGEVYIEAEGLREDRYCTGGCDRGRKGKKRTKLGTYRFITNFLEGSIKDKKIEKILYTYVRVHYTFLTG